MMVPISSRPRPDTVVYLLPYSTQKFTCRPLYWPKNPGEGPPLAEKPADRAESNFAQALYRLAQANLQERDFEEAVGA